MKKPLLITLAVAIFAAAGMLFLWLSKSENPAPVPEAQSNAPDPTTLVTSPKSGKTHALSEFKPAPARPGWVICPDTGQQIPIASLKR